MPDNLTVEISANSGKFRAELTLLQKQLRDVRKDLSAAANAGDTAEVNRLSVAYEKLTAQIRGTSRALSEQNRAAAGAARELGAVSTAVDNIGLAAGRAQTAFRALFALQGMRQASTAIDDVYSKLNELNKTAAGNGFTPQGVKTIEEIFGDVGVKTDVTRQALSSFNDVVTEARQKLKGMKEDAVASAAGVNVMRGSVASLGDTVQTLRGGVKPIDDTSQAVASLTTAMRDIGKTFDIRQFKTQEDAFKGVAGALTELNKVKPEKAAEIGKDFFKRPWAEIAKGIFAVGEAWNKTQADLNASGRMPTPADEKALNEYIAAIDAVGDAWEAAKKKGVLSTHDTTIAVLNAAAQLIEAAGQINTGFDQFTKDGDAPLGGNLVKNTLREFDQLGVFFGTTLPGWARATWDDLKKGFADLGAAFSNAFTTAFENVKTAANDLFNWMLGWVTKIGSALSNPTGSSAAGTSPAVPGAVYAAGGHVRGPGSATSDSILARLSNGEFVMRAAAVRAWGPQLLSAMNALNRPLPGVANGSGFADGGMVSATTSEGATVNLHFPGGSFALRGDKAIVMGLTREARRASLLTAGRSPGAALA